MSYEQALTAARLGPLTVPPFETIVAAADRERTAKSREDHDHRIRARRWMLVSAALWLLLPLDALMFGMLGISGVGQLTVRALTLEVALMVLPTALVSLWGARLVQRREFRAAILSRAIAASNLIVALLYAASVGGMFGAAFASLLALASARTLALLGERGLDGSEDPSTEFEPVRFRKLLIVALILAFADALTLGFSSSLVGVRTLGLALSGVEIHSVSSLVLTAAAALLMIINVRGLLRLRTWALFGTMLSNIGVAALALRSMLALNFYVAIGLTVTAAAQLLLVVPVIAAALGDEQAGRSHERIDTIVRWVVPALVIATIVMAALGFGPALPGRWFIPRWPS